MTHSRSLPSASTLPVLSIQARPRPTHEVRFTCQFRRPEGERYMLGSILVRLNDRQDYERLGRLQRRLAVHFGQYLRWDTFPLEVLKEANRLSNLERMRRKWAKVMRAYASDRADIESGRKGMFIADRIAELDALLERAQAKVEKTYGHPITDLANAALAQRAAELDQHGLIDRTDHTHLS